MTKTHKEPAKAKPAVQMVPEHHARDRYERLFEPKPYSEARHAFDYARQVYRHIELARGKKAAGEAQNLTFTDEDGVEWLLCAKDFLQKAAKLKSSGVTRRALARNQRNGVLVGRRITHKLRQQYKLPKWAFNRTALRFTILGRLPFDATVTDADITAAAASGGSKISPSGSSKNPLLGGQKWPPTGGSKIASHWGVKNDPSIEIQLQKTETEGPLDKNPVGVDTHTFPQASGKTKTEKMGEGNVANDLSPETPATSSPAPQGKFAKENFGDGKITPAVWTALLTELQIPQVLTDKERAIVKQLDKKFADAFMMTGAAALPHVDVLRAVLADWADFTAKAQKSKGHKLTFACPEQPDPWYVSTYAGIAVQFALDQVAAAAKKVAQEKAAAEQKVQWEAEHKAQQAKWAAEAAAKKAAADEKQAKLAAEQAAKAEKTALQAPLKADLEARLAEAKKLAHALSWDEAPAGTESGAVDRLIKNLKGALAYLSWAKSKPTVTLAELEAQCPLTYEACCKGMPGAKQSPDAFWNIIDDEVPPPAPKAEPVAAAPQDAAGGPTASAAEPETAPTAPPEVAAANPLPTSLQMLKGLAAEKMQVPPLQEVQAPPVEAPATLSVVVKKPAAAKTPAKKVAKKAPPKTQLPPAKAELSLYDDLVRRNLECFAKWKALKKADAPKAEIERYRRLGENLKAACALLKENGAMTWTDLEEQLGPLTLAGIDALVADEQAPKAAVAALPSAPPPAPVAAVSNYTAAPTPAAAPLVDPAQSPLHAALFKLLQAAAENRVAETSPHAAVINPAMQLVVDNIGAAVTLLCDHPQLLAENPALSVRDLQQRVGPLYLGPALVHVLKAQMSAEAAPPPPKYASLAIDPPSPTAVTPKPAKLSFLAQVQKKKAAAAHTAAC